MISWSYFEELLKKTKEPVMKELDRTMKWKLEKLKQSVSEVIKELG
jgi:hypothetical protein